MIGTDPTEAMLTIKSLDPRSTLHLSEWTRRWYVSSTIEISDGSVIGGITEHRDTPDEAVAGYLERLTAVDFSDLGHVLVTRPAGERRHHRWNGAAFVEEPIAAFMSEVAS